MNLAGLSRAALEEYAHNLEAIVEATGPAIRTNMSAYQLASDAIGLFLEYRDVHGYDEDMARGYAATEVQQGVDAEVELRAAGEIK
jgi:hypothetical protein